jgi:hypothetical protein
MPKTYSAVFACLRCRSAGIAPFDVRVEATENDYGCALPFSAASTRTGAMRGGRA